MIKNEVRRQVGKSPIETMNDFIDRDFDSLDADVDIYTGIVVNNNDPDKQGKCQIRVYGVFGDEVPNSDLPWALPDFGFVGSSVGSFVVPPNGALVKVYFDRGDIYLPHYTTKAVNINSQPTQKDIDYPDNMVMYETDDGDYFTVNRKTKETTFNHNSGTKVLIKEDGSVEIDVVKNKTETIEKNKTETVKGNETKTIEGTQEIKSPNIKIEGDKVEISGFNGPGQLTVNGNVAPTGSGPFCGLPSCVITGAPQVGSVVLNT